MRNRVIGLTIAVLAILGLWHARPASTAEQSSVAKAQTAGSIPDLTGVWMERKFQPKMYLNGDPPLQAWSQWRRIYTDGRQHPKDLDATFMGHSTGKYEGDTLVVDTIGFNEKTWLDHVGLPHSDALHVVERIRRVDHNTLQDDFTIDDPKTFTKTWTAQQLYDLKPDWEIGEFVCDNNKYASKKK